MPVKTSPAMTATDLVASEKWASAKVKQEEWGKLEVGDIIQFNVPEKTGKIHHWAVYVGNGKIIHFNTEDSSGSKGKLNNSFKVLKSSLVESAKETLVRVRNWADEGYWTKKWFWQEPTKVNMKPLPKDEIVARAEESLREQNFKSYHLLDNNCECFATYCRYGQGISGQGIAFWWGIGGS